VAPFLNSIAMKNMNAFYPYQAGLFVPRDL
jgi:hypothetical protein